MKLSDRLHIRLRIFPPMNGQTGTLAADFYARMGLLSGEAVCYSSSVKVSNCNIPFILHVDDFHVWIPFDRAGVLQNDKRVADCERTGRDQTHDRSPKVSPPCRLWSPSRSACCLTTFCLSASVYGRCRQCSHSRSVVLPARLHPVRQL